MDTKDIPYLLQRVRFHRDMARTTKCGEARCAHHQFVKNYQQRLLIIRKERNPQIQVVQDLAFV